MFRYDERLDPEIAAVLDGLPRYDLDDIAEARRRRRELAEATRAHAVPDPDVVVEELVLPAGVTVRVSRPRLESGGGRLLWVHGGGHVLGEAAQDDWLMAEVVADTCCTAVAVEWRRAPEHPFPAALDDCYRTALAGRPPARHRTAGGRGCQLGRGARRRPRPPGP